MDQANWRFGESQVRDIKMWPDGLITVGKSCRDQANPVIRAMPMEKYIKEEVGIQAERRGHWK